MINKEWLEAEKKIDPNYEGSVFQKMGFDALLCPVCNAHLRDGICLNNCHLDRSFKNKESTDFGIQHKCDMKSPLLEVCEANGYRLLEIVDYIDGMRNTRYQVIDPDNNPVGEPYITIYSAFQLFRNLLGKPKEGNGWGKVKKTT